MNRAPDFIVIGAMKCATSTLHEQLAAQPGFFLSTPKEPCFFSDDEVYARGWEWYTGLFAGARAGDVCGESSTHYTKLPTYPRTVERMARHLSNVRLIYMMRHPIDRLVSQYIHEWTQRTIDGPIDEAVQRFPRLIDYGRYGMQLRPYFEAFGRDRVLPVFQERLHHQPQAELERVCRFIGYTGIPRWQQELSAANVSSERLRKSAWRDALLHWPGMTTLRRRLVPRSVRDRIKRLWTMNERPKLGDARLAELRRVYNDDLGELGSWLGIELTCENFKEAAAQRPLEWAATAGTGR